MFTDPKVRVHSVLKQQKTRESSHVVMETEMQEKDHLEKVNKQLKTKLQEVRSVVTLGMVYSMKDFKRTSLF